MGRLRLLTTFNNKGPLHILSLIKCYLSLKDSLRSIFNLLLKFHMMLNTRNLIPIFLVVRGQVAVDLIYLLSYLFSPSLKKELPVQSQAKVIKSIAITVMKSFVINRNNNYVNKKLLTINHSDL